MEIREPAIVRGPTGQRKTKANSGQTAKWKLEPGRADWIVKSVARSLSRVIARFSKPLPVTVANTIDEFHTAFAVVYQEYNRKGICEENASKYYCTHFATLPSSVTFVLGDRVCPHGTLTAVLDTKWGLPLEELYAEELEDMRHEKNRTFVELGHLALNSQLIPQQKRSLLSGKKLHSLFSLLFGVIHYLVYETEATDMVAVVHPRHRSIYELLGFKQFAPVRSYKGACGKPALPIRCDLKDAMRFIESVSAVPFAETAIAFAQKNSDEDWLALELLLREDKLRHRLTSETLWQLLADSSRLVDQNYLPKLPRTIESSMHGNLLLS